MTKITKDATDTDRAQAGDADDTVVLLVLARERPAVARALLAHAPDPLVVRTTSEGFAVPRHLAELAGLVLAEDVEAPVGASTPVYAAALGHAGDQAPPPADPDPDGDGARGRRRGGKGADK